VLLGVAQWRDALGRDQEERLKEKQNISKYNKDQKGNIIGQYSQRREVNVGRFALAHLVDHDAKRPDVHLAVVLFTFDHFLYIHDS